ncbi:C2 domain-containing protein [Entamoeba marina]
MKTTYDANYPQYLQSYKTRVSPFDSSVDIQTQLQNELQMIDVALKGNNFDNSLQVDVKENNIIAKGKCNNKDVCLMLYTRGNTQYSYYEDIKEPTFRFSFLVEPGLYEIKICESKTTKTLMGKTNVVVGDFIEFQANHDTNGVIVEFDNKADGTVGIFEMNDAGEVIFETKQCYRILENTTKQLLRSDMKEGPYEIRYYDKITRTNEVKMHTPYNGYTKYVQPN